MRKSSEIEKELEESKELAKASGLLADEKAFIEDEIKNLKKELKSALDAEDKAPSKKVVAKAIDKVATKKAINKVVAKKEVAKTPTKKEKSFIIFEGKKIYEDDVNYCENLIKAYEKRKTDRKKSAGKRKTKPVTQRVAANVASAVMKGIKTIPTKDIAKNPAAEIKKMERLEKAGKEFLSAYKDILGDTVTQKEIKEEFDGLDTIIENIKKKFIKK